MLSFSVYGTQQIFRFSVQFWTPKPITETAGLIDTEKQNRNFGLVWTDTETETKTKMHTETESFQSLD